DGSVTGNSLIAATSAAVKQYPQCVAYGIWNNGRGQLADFVDTSAASLAQYRTLAHDPWFALTRSCGRRLSDAALSDAGGDGVARPVGRGRESWPEGFPRCGGCASRVALRTCVTSTSTSVP